MTRWAALKTADAMSLLYKPGWDETRKRYEAWWAHEALDRFNT